MYTFFDKIPEFINRLTDCEELEHVKTRGRSLFFPKNKSVSDGIAFIKSRNQNEFCSLSYRAPCIQISAQSDRYLLEFSNKIVLSPDWGSQGFYGFCPSDNSGAYRCIYVFKDGNVMLSRKDGKGRYPVSLQHFSRAILDVGYEFLHTRDLFYKTILQAFLSCDDSFLFKDLKDDLAYIDNSLVIYSFENKDIAIKDLFLEENRAGKTALYRNIYKKYYNKYYGVCPLTLVNKLNQINEYLKKNDYAIDFSQTIVEFASRFHRANVSKEKYFLSGEAFSQAMLQKHYSFQNKKDGLVYLLGLYIILRCVPKKTKGKNVIEKPKQEYAEIMDYVRFCIEYKERIHFKKTSIESVLNEHKDQIARMYSDIDRLNATGKKLLRKSSLFYKLSPLEGMTLLETDKALAIEGQAQRNCVFSYAKHVEKGDIAIYSLVYEDARYTVEISLSKDGKIELTQMRGKYNAIPQQNVVRYVTMWVKKQNLILKKLSKI